MVGHVPLEHGILVRIQVPQHIQNNPAWGCFVCAARVQRRLEASQLDEKGGPMRPQEGTPGALEPRPCDGKAESVR